MSRPAEEFDEPDRKIDIVEHDVRLKRAVSKQHIEELARILPHGFLCQADLNLEPPVRLLANRFDLTDDLGANECILDRRNRHLDALLNRNGARACLDRTSLAMHAIGDVEARLHVRCPSPPLGYGHAAKHFGDAGARGARRIVGQSFERKKAVRHDFMIGPGHGRLPEFAYDEQSDMIATRDPPVVEHAMQLSWPRQLDIALLEQLARKGL